MTIEKKAVYKITGYNTGPLYEETPKRAFAWELYCFLKNKNISQPNFSDMLTIIDNYAEVVQILADYAATEYGIDIHERD